MFDLFLLFVERPAVALIPALLLGLAAWRLKRRRLWTAAAAWLAYAAYEAGVQARWLCSGECNIRADLLFIAPLLLGLSLVALVSVVWTADRRRSQ